MIDIRVYCTDHACEQHEARYKIAAEWTGGGVAELKTFGFADEHCLARVLASAKERAANIHLAEGERLGNMRIYRLDIHRHDVELERDLDLEKRFG